MSITDCTICKNPLDHGPVVAHGGGFAHGCCYVLHQVRGRGISAICPHTVGCGTCPSCEEGHPERCGRAGCAT